MTEIFTLPFMQRAFAAGIMLALLLGAVGVFVIMRRLSFFGDGVAHASLAGIAIGILSGLAPMPFAIIWAVIFALLMYWLEKRTKLPSDALIGVLFTASLALGVVLMSRVPGYQPELVSFLFGSILAVNFRDLLIIAALGALIGLWLWKNHRSLVYASLDQEGAKIAGINVERITIMFYSVLAVSIVLGIKMLGVILVSALLIIPASVARIAARNFSGFYLTSVILAEIIVILGLIVSYILDLPSGATIILVGTALFTAALFAPRSGTRVGT